MPLIHARGWDGSGAVGAVWVVGQVQGPRGTAGRPDLEPTRGGPPMVPDGGTELGQGPAATGIFPYPALPRHGRRRTQSGGDAGGRGIVGSRAFQVVAFAVPRRAGDEMGVHIVERSHPIHSARARVVDDA